MRRYAPTATPDVVQMLGRLAAPPEQTGVEDYRAAMTAAGEWFVRANRDRLAGITRLLLICTNEDADFLARGVLSALDGPSGPALLVACFWNDREKIVGDSSGLVVDVAPIVRRYVEPGQVDAFLVVKSIISSACVVRTNITELVYDRNPQRVLIFAPVIFKGADQKLRAEFDDDVSRRFEFYWFAEDDEREGETVKPGIGGQVYERLGFGGRTDRNRHVPDLVRARRRV